MLGSSKNNPLLPFPWWIALLASIVAQQPHRKMSEPIEQSSGSSKHSDDLTEPSDHSSMYSEEEEYSSDDGETMQQRTLRTLVEGCKASSTDDSCRVTCGGSVPANQPIRLFFEVKDHGWQSVTLEGVQRTA